MGKMIKLETNLARDAPGFLKEHYDWFRPVKKLTVYFDTEKFLLTEYKTVAHLVLENHHGDQLHIGGADCGYDGEGQNATAAILQLLGVPKVLAHILIQEDGMQLEFDKKETCVKSGRKCSLAPPAGRGILLS